jgi:hypothetical protein
MFFFNKADEIKVCLEKFKLQLINKNLNNIKEIF